MILEVCVDLECGLLAKESILSAFQRLGQFIYFSLSGKIRKKNLKIERININNLILTWNCYSKAFKIF